MERRVAQLLLVLLTMAGASCLLSACQPVPACTHQWVGPFNGGFGVAANWDTGTVPGEDDVACAPKDSYLELSDARTVRRVSFLGSVLNVKATGSLTVVGAFSQASYLNLEGTLAGRGGMTVLSLNVSGSATFSGAGTTTALKHTSITGTPEVRNNAALALLGTTDLSGTTRVCESGSLRFGGDETSSSATITSAGCPVIGVPRITTTTTWHHAGNLTTDLPIESTGCDVRLAGIVAASSYRQLDNPDCSPGGTRTALAPGSVLTAPVHLDSGRLTGFGAINGSVDGVGIIEPGDASTLGTLTVNGNYTPATGAIVSVDVRFTGGIATDVLRVTGTASLANATLTPGLLSASDHGVKGVTFKPVVAGTRVGTFAAVTPRPGTIPTWTTTYVADGVVLTTQKGTPVITWPSPGAVLAGAPLSAVELNATASTPGTFVYSPAAGATLSVGSNQTLSVTFHPTDTATYGDAVASVSVNVTATAPTVTWANPAPITAWTPLSTAQLNATASVPGRFIYSLPVGTVLPQGAARPLSVLFVPTNRAAFPTVTRTVTIDVTAGPALDTFRAQVDTLGPQGSGTSVADLDGDGRGDVVETSATGDLVMVLYGAAGGTFSPRVSFPTGDFPVDTAIGDLNGDRRPDIVVLNSTGQSISVLLGTGGRAFAPHVDVPTMASPNAVAIGDLDGDGRPDIAVLSSDAIRVLWGTGTGAFAPSTSYPISGGVRDLHLTDLNGDGRADLALSSQSPGTGYGRISVMLNLGTGTFGPAAHHTTGTYPGSLAVGDVTGDGKPDLVAAAAGDSFPQLFVFAGVGDGTFSARVTHLVGSASNPSTVSIGDLNGDGRADIAAFTRASVHVLQGTGGGAFVLSGPHPFGQPPSSTLGGVVGDIDGDHRPDLVGTGYATAGGVTSVLLGARTPAVTWNAPAAITAGTPLSATQLNASSTVAGTFVYSPPAGTVLTVGPARILTVTFTPTDLATYTPVTRTVSLDVIGPGSFGSRADYAGSPNHNPVALSDVDGDGHLDLISLLDNPSLLTVRKGSASGAFGAATGFPAGANPRDLVLGDFNGDLKVDVAVTNGNSTFSLFIGSGTGSFGFRVDRATDFEPFHLAAADVNGDGKLDVITVNTGSSGSLSLFLGKGNGGFETRTDIPSGTYPGKIATGDLNGDGRADVVVTGNSNGNTQRIISTWLGTPTGLGPRVDRIVEQPSALLLVDVTGDGFRDLVWASEYAAAAGRSVARVTPGTGLGTFDWANTWSAPVSTSPTATHDIPVRLAVADVNRDGTLDLLTANAGTATMSVLLGTGGGTFGGMPATYALPSGIQSLAIGDVNKDGKVDVVTGSTVDSVFFGS